MGELVIQGAVTMPELIASSLAQTDALTKLLIEKGIITKEDQLRECIEAGCNDYIVKPFAPNELVSRIEKLLM
jgi:DNA-binding response OmpR family regulator